MIQKKITDLFKLIRERMCLLSLYQIVAFGYLVKLQNGNQFKFNWRILHFTILNHVLMYGTMISGISLFSFSTFRHSGLCQWKYTKVTFSFLTPINHGFSLLNAIMFYLNFTFNSWFCCKETLLIPNVQEVTVVRESSQEANLRQNLSSSVWHQICELLYNYFSTLVYFIIKQYWVCLAQTHYEQHSLMITAATQMQYRCGTFHCYSY